MWAPVWEWLLYHLPWWVWVAIAIALWAGLAWLVGMLFGWKYARFMLWPAVALVAALAIALSQRQKGYADRKDEEAVGLDTAIHDIEEHRKEVDKKPIDQIDKENSKWLRP